MSRQDAKQLSRRQQGRPVIEVLRPRCPRCYSVRLHRDGGIREGDGSYRRYVHCLECGLKAFVVIQD